MEILTACGPQNQTITASEVKDKNTLRNLFWLQEIISKMTTQKQ